MPWYERKCIEAGLDNIILYVGGNIVVGKQDFKEVEQRFLDMGFNRVFPPGTKIESVLDIIAKDLVEYGKNTLIDFGSTYTKLTAVSLKGERLLLAAKSFTTVGSDIKDGYHKALKTLSKNRKD